MSADTTGGGYPVSRVHPELFSPESGCATTLPAGEVIEWFDFGQFIELYATDASGESHPLVVTQDDAVLQASLRVRDDTGSPTRTVDLAGGVPLSRAVAGDGAEAFKAIGVPDQVVVEDVDQLVRSGTIAANGTTYTLTLRGAQIDAIRDGEPQLLRAHAETGSDSRRAWLQLLPHVLDAPVLTSEALDRLLAEPVIKVADSTAEPEEIRLALEPLEVAALLAERTVVVRGTSGGRTRLVRLRQREQLAVGFAAAPAVTDYAIANLAAFLAHPVIPGTEGLPFKVPLDPSVVQQLRRGVTAQIQLGEGRVLTLRLEARTP
jgi:hypothetical protein